MGDRKMVVYNDLSDNERIRIYDVGVDPAEIGEGPAPYEMPVTYRTGDITSPYVEFVEPLLVQDTHFIDCVRTGRRPDTPGERGLGVVRVLAATDEARATGAPARIQPPCGRQHPNDSGRCRSPRDRSRGFGAISGPGLRQRRPARANTSSHGRRCSSTGGSSVAPRSNSSRRALPPTARPPHVSGWRTARTRWN